MIGFTKLFISAAAAASAVAAAPIVKRDAPVSAYKVVVDGLSSAVQAGPGSNYLGFRTLSWYDIAACQGYCNTESSGSCQSINIFRETYTEGSSGVTYKCSLWGEHKSASDATNYGQQDQGNGGLTQISWSQIQNRGSTYSNTPLKGAILASDAGHYLGKKDIGPAYDPAACAQACDSTDGCKYANLWQGWSQAGGNDRPTCALFGDGANVSGTDTNYGQGDLYVTNSRLLTKQ
ncbi:hypothetical protein IE53DRAFT_376478 [Violaceomyces palustris]|uniref:Uncharacterized protein n=1 Tax=Violaceomyces palustris TaxID=1673888 RepID=A0ACD0P8W1_9BASI|nr:hypothetical protein IE53DRAFT_376478 [Violaceomyces palustris]